MGSLARMYATALGLGLLLVLAPFWTRTNVGATLGQGLLLVFVVGIIWVLAGSRALMHRLVCGAVIIGAFLLSRLLDQPARHVIFRLNYRHYHEAAQSFVKTGSLPAEVGGIGFYGASVGESGSFLIRTSSLATVEHTVFLRTPPVGEFVLHDDLGYWVLVAR